MPDSDFDLFSVERLKVYAAQDRFASFTLENKWGNEAYLRAWFNSEIAQNSRTMAVYKEVNGIEDAQA